MTNPREKSEADHDLGSGFVRKNIHTDDGRLSYLFRRGLEPNLILIPGSFNDSLALKDIIDHLDKERGLVVFELRGHGGSWPPTVNGSIELFSQDTLEVVDEMNLDSFYIGGHSIGGMIALEVARVRPKSVKGVLSLEGWTSHHAQHDAFEVGGGDPVTNTLSPQQYEVRVALRKRVMEHWSEEEIDHFPTIWKKWDGYDFLSSTDIPILELYGDRGRERPGLDKLYIPERDNIEFHWMENVSHYLPIECPREVAQLCDNFIKRVEGTG